MPRPRHALKGSTEWLLCRREVHRIFERHKAPAGLFEHFGPLVFGAVTTARLTERQGLELAALVTRHRNLMPALLHDVRRLWDRKCRTALFVASNWIARRWRMIRSENRHAQWPWDDGQTALLIERDTGQKNISKQTVKDARKLIRRHPPQAPARKSRRLQTVKLDSPQKLRRALRALVASNFLRAPEYYCRAPVV